MLAAAPVLVTAALLLAGCQQAPGGRAENTGGPRTSAASPSSDPGPAKIRLPGNAWLSDMALTDDGTLWVAESSLAAIAEIAPTGKVTQHPLPRMPGYPSSPSDLQVSPDGGIWYAAGDQLGHLDPSGRFTWWGSGPTADDNGPGSDDGVGFPDALTLGPDSTIWYAHAVRGSPALSRADKRRGLSGIAILQDLKGRFTTPIGRMALGPDHAVWFCQSYHYDENGRDGIGRVTAQGDYQGWPLPRGTIPWNIVAGPDKAMWFTEKGGIGRITVTGDFSHFAVRGSKRTRDITVGADGALWFTTDSGVGRITPSGKITLWPVPGAKNLTSIVAIPGGGFWLADRDTDTVLRFSPPR